MRQLAAPHQIEAAARHINYAFPAISDNMMASCEFRRVIFRTRSSGRVLANSLTPRAIFPRAFPERSALSPLEALRPAWEATHSLLFRPFQRKQWISLSIVCLFLGGGTSTAAFQWGFSALPIDFRAADTMLRLRYVLAEHASLAFLATTLTLV